MAPLRWEATGCPVTVVMITRDRRDSALRSVEQLRALPEQPPVVVVDNGSADRTAAALREIEGVTVAASVDNLGSAGRTVGVALATTPYVAFADDDSWWAAGALERAADVLDRHPGLALLVARTLVGLTEREDPLNRLLAAAPFGRRRDLPGPTAAGFLACAAVVRRGPFLAAGGFHRRYGVGGEERLLAVELLTRGWGIAYVPEVIAHHHPTPGPERVGRRIQQARNDLWTAWLRRRWPTVLTVTGQAARTAEGRAALRAAARGLPWIVRERSAVDRSLETMLRAAD